MTSLDLLALVHSIHYMEHHMRNVLDVEPVRLYSIAAAAVALVAHFVPGLPVALILALVAAILGTGQKVRAKVRPVAKDPEPYGLP